MDLNQLSIIMESSHDGVRGQECLDTGSLIRHKFMGGFILI
jgi:hypothetical protein